MKLIDKYIHAVVMKLPKEQREDVGKELKSNILDMLSPDFTDDELDRVLEELGSPSKLASQYRGKERYLIGPDYYDQYIQTLKLVVPIVVIILMGIEAFKGMFQFGPLNSVPTYVQFFTSLIGTGVGSLFSTFAWITVIFVIIERATGGINDSQVNWSVSQLKEMPEPVTNGFSIAESVAEIGLAVFFLGGLYFFSDRIGVYTMIGDQYQMVEPLFNPAVMKNIMPYLFFLLVLELINAILKYKFKSWNQPLLFFNIFIQIISTIGFVYLILGTTLINYEVFTVIQNQTSIAEGALRFLELMPLIAVAIAIVSGISNIFSMIRKSTAQESITY